MSGFLRNPFFVPDLKPLTGEDPRVRNYVLTDPDAVAFIGQLESLFKFLIPLFERERRSYVNVGIGSPVGAIGLWPLLPGSKKVFPRMDIKRPWRIAISIGNNHGPVRSSSRHRGPVSVSVRVQGKRFP